MVESLRDADIPSSGISCFTVRNACETPRRPSLQRRMDVASLRVQDTTAAPKERAAQVRGFIRHWNRHEAPPTPLGLGAPTRFKIPDVSLPERRATMPTYQPSLGTPTELANSSGMPAPATSELASMALTSSSSPGRQATPCATFACAADAVPSGASTLDHRGRWERAPVRALLDEVVASVLRDFPWTLTPLDTDHPE